MNVFSERGVATQVVEFDATGSLSSDAPSQVRTTEQRLDDLEALKQKEAITPQEYEVQRKRILDTL